MGSRTGLKPSGFAHEVPTLRNGWKHEQKRDSAGDDDFAGEESRGEESGRWQVSPFAAKPVKEKKQRKVESDHKGDGGTIEAMQGVARGDDRAG